MVDSPNSGFGRCQATHEVIIETPMSIMMVGGAPNLFSRVFNAVHVANRVGSKDDFVGINFPDFDADGKGFDRFGRTFLLVGSEDALSAVLSKPDLAPIIEEFGFDDIFPHDAVTEVGQAILRERNSERHTKGDLERRMRRAQRLGKPIEGYKKGLADLAEGKRPSFYKYGTCDLFLQLSEIKFSMQVIEALSTGTVEVSTYGVSSNKNPLVCKNRNTARKAA